MTEPAIDLDAGARLDLPSAIATAVCAHKSIRGLGVDAMCELHGFIQEAVAVALPARATLDAGALEKALTDTPKNDRYPKIQAIRAYLAARSATGAGEWRPIATAPNTSRREPILICSSEHGPDIAYRSKYSDLWYRKDGRGVNYLPTHFALLQPLPAPPLPSPQSRV